MPIPDHLIDRLARALGDALVGDYHKFRVAPSGDCGAEWCTDQLPRARTSTARRTVTLREWVSYFQQQTLQPVGVPVMAGTEWAA